MPGSRWHGGGAALSDEEDRTPRSQDDPRDEDDLTSVRPRSADEDERREAARDLAKRLAGIAWEKRAEEIVILDTTQVFGLSDYFVICTARNPRQARIIAEECDLHVKHSGRYRHPPIEGTGEAIWVCADFGDVILHVFQEEARRLYDLEHHWGDAPRLEWEPEVRVPGGDAQAG